MFTFSLSALAFWGLSLGVVYGAYQSLKKSTSWFWRVLYLFGAAVIVGFLYLLFFVGNSPDKPDKPLTWEQKVQQQFTPMG